MMDPPVEQFILSQGVYVGPSAARRNDGTEERGMRGSGQGRGNRENYLAVEPGFRRAKSRRAWRGRPWIAAFVALVALVARAAMAQQAAPALHQWRAIHESLFDLINDGYQIVSVTDWSDKADTYTTKTFYLQKPKTAAKCYETYAIGVKSVSTNSALICFALVSPYAPDK
jgi:hypothetical protein